MGIKFSPAPWQGGLFERSISIVKGILHKVFHKCSVTKDELQIALVEIEAVVNNRPLVYLGDEARACEAFTPSHLLYGRKLMLYPTLDTHHFYYDTLDNTDVLLEYHNKVNQNIRKFSRLWEQDYLQALREKHYTQSNSLLMRVPQVEEVVIVSQGSKSDWTLGSVTPQKRLMDLEKRLRDFPRSVVTSEKHLRDFPPPWHLLPGLLHHQLPR